MKVSMRSDRCDRGRDGLVAGCSMVLSLLRPGTFGVVDDRFYEVLGRHLTIPHIHGVHLMLVAYQSLPTFPPGARSASRRGGCGLRAELG